MNQQNMRWKEGLARNNEGATKAKERQQGTMKEKYQVKETKQGNVYTNEQYQQCKGEEELWYIEMFW